MCVSVKNRVVKVFFAAVTILLAAGVCSATVLAYATFNGHKCRRGCALLWYVYPNASMYVEDVVTGAYRWNITSTPISLDRTYETGPSSIDVHYAYRSSGWHAWDNAWTEMVRQDYGEIDPDEEDWDYARIFINRYRSIPDTERTCVIVCHEMGHAFGLAHTNSQPENIMCQEASGRTTHNPSADDAAGINYLYD